MSQMPEHLHTQIPLIAEAWCKVSSAIELFSLLPQFEILIGSPVGIPIRIPLGILVGILGESL